MVRYEAGATTLENVSTWPNTALNLTRYKTRGQVFTLAFVLAVVKKGIKSLVSIVWLASKKTGLEYFSK